MGGNFQNGITNWSSRIGFCKDAFGKLAKMGELYVFCIIVLQFAQLDGQNELYVLAILYGHFVSPLTNVHI